MQVFHGLEGLRALPPKTALSIGNFDGFHRGHQLIVRTCRELIGPAGKVALVTFEPHPLTVLRPELAPPRLTSLSMKESILARHGVDYLVVLPPRPEVLNLSAEAFWQILRDDVRPGFLVEGPEFNFGKNRSGNIDRLREWAAGSAITLKVIEPLQVVLSDLTIVHVSSSLIRFLLSWGRARDAAICLARAYLLEGKVVQGFGRGRKIGIPTANIDCPDQLIPSDGVYAARCALDGTIWPAALSIGTLPTFGEHQRQVEAHLIGFDGDLYRRTIALELIDWIRDQAKFASVDDLKSRMMRDLQYTVERTSLAGFRG